ncbi:MAG: histidine phosphatase family protein [Hyphomicrobium sp.]
MTFIDWLRSLLGGTRVSGGTPFAAGQGPSHVIVMRHGEKTGDKFDPHLSAEGQQRAQNLATYIPKQFGKPDFLIAAAESKRSNRPYETLLPLAQACNLEIIEDFRDEDVEEVVDMLSREQRFAGKYGVICWRHSDLPRLIASLGAPDGTYPDPWNPATFDLLVDVAYVGAGAPQVRCITPSF